MFNPSPVNGKDLYKNRKPNAAHLTWFPTFVEVAASGDFGISTGPWEFRKTKSDTPVAYGHFFSVWKKQTDGTWKVAFDNGISYSKAIKRTEPEHVKMLSSVKTKAGISGQSLTDLMDTERKFIKSFNDKGMIASYSQFAADNMRVYRNGNFPSQQKREALELLKKQGEQKDFSPMETQIASTGELGYTYGISVDANNDSSSYIRVWRKDKEWKIAVDMLAPFKKE
jgi:ketosteroid isomerase-like protein